MGSGKDGDEYAGHVLYFSMFQHLEFGKEGSVGQYGPHGIVHAWYWIQSGVRWSEKDK